MQCIDVWVVLHMVHSGYVKCTAFFKRIPAFSGKVDEQNNVVQHQSLKAQRYALDAMAHTHSKGCMELTWQDCPAAWWPACICWACTMSCMQQLKMLASP